ncbi:hypothetical protein MG293_010251 [Ovis ammon polii]|uniref:Uncharacterized protein n=1 Tax=Ovis ammon polii TaxID=230172 RepID=A0AAD4U5Z4_OVIAM|nr:hypothetical protein MG293_010251 [Ovis ammon polii]
MDCSGRTEELSFKGGFYKPNKGVNILQTEKNHKQQQYIKEGGNDAIALAAVPSQPLEKPKDLITFPTLIPPQAQSILLGVKEEMKVKDAIKCNSGNEGKENGIEQRLTIKTHHSEKKLAEDSSLIFSVFDYEMLPQIPTEGVKGEHVYRITFIKYENSEHVDTYDHTVSEEGLWIINWFSLICYFSTLMLDYRIRSMKITEKCSVDIFPDSKGRLQHDRIKSETQAKNGNKTNELSDKWKQKMPRNQCSTGEPEVPPTPTLPRRYTCSISFLCHVAPFWYT